jgi:hypothetical protein
MGMIVARTLLLATAGMAALTLVTGAAAQPGTGGQTRTQASRTTSYDAAFFAQYAPRTALDIVQRVPGFTIDLGNNQNGQDVRGFAGTAGNVVINGARPSSKAEALDTLLSRIPARSVVKVEVGPGDLYGADYSSKSQVLNLILSAQSGFNANVNARAQRLYFGRIIPDVSGSAQMKRGHSTFNLSGGIGRGDFQEEGTDRVVDASTGDLIEFRRKINHIHPHDPYVSGSWALEESQDKAIRLNARWAPSTFRLTQTNHVVPTGDPERDDALVQDYHRPAFELGGDVTRPLAGGAIKLVGLATRRKRDDTETYFVRDLGGQNILGGSESATRAKRGETIGRLSWTKQNFLGVSFEAGAETAWNTLDAHLAFFSFEPGGARTPIELPIQNATVKELRGEAYVKAGKQLSKAIRLDVGLNYEASRLKVSGDAAADRSLKFLKPSLTLDVNAGGGWHGQFIARRTVAQLDFYDFISSAELSVGRVNSGNANLQPQRAWEFSAVLERPILGEGNLRFELGHNRISMLQDRILVLDDQGNAFDAPGNIGSGTQSFVHVTLDAPLSRFGLTGVRFKFDGQVQKTRVEDPISGATRDFSGFFPAWQWNAELRRDAGKFAYGVNAQDNARITFFRTDELDRNQNLGAFASAFIEYRLSGATSLRLDVNNILNNGGGRSRTFFSPNRTNPVPVAYEVRERNVHVGMILTLKQSFGGGAKNDSVK